MFVGGGGRKSQERNPLPPCASPAGIKNNNAVSQHFFLRYPAREGVFWGTAAAGLPVPDFPCFVFGGNFLAECKYLRETVHGCTV